ncbi:porin family protein [Lacinutrix salivirga]
MRKLLSIAVFTVLGLSSINAQEIKFGAKGGVNFSSISGENTDGVENLTSFHAGAVAEIMISDRVSFQPEVLYSKQGANSSFENELEKDEYKYSLDYINVPLLAKIYIAEGFSVVAGPQIGFLLNAEEEYNYTSKSGVVRNISTTEDVKEFYKSTDFSTSLGLGYQFDNGLNFGARYNLGLSNINDGNDTDDSKNQNNAIQVSVGFMF